MHITILPKTNDKEVFIIYLMKKSPSASKVNSCSLKSLCTGASLVFQWLKIPPPTHSGHRFDP